MSTSLGVPVNTALKRPLRNIEGIERFEWQIDNDEGWDWFRLSVSRYGVLNTPVDKSILKFTKNGDVIIICDVVNYKQGCNFLGKIDEHQLVALILLICVGNEKDKFMEWLSYERKIKHD